MTQWTLRDEWQAAEIHVPHAALLIARDIAYPDLDIAESLATLTELTELAASRVNTGQAAVAQAEQVAQFLFEDLGFTGNGEDYYDPRNSFLNDVLERRTGLPITLSILCIEVATRLGLPAYGVGLPGHFIVGIDDQTGSHWLDPFHGGRWLSLNDCAEIIEAVTGYDGALDASWFSPVSPRDTLARLVGNLRSTFVHRKQWGLAARAIHVLQTMQPDSAEHLRDLGLVYLRQQSIPQAAYFLNEYLAHVPNASDAAMIRQGTKQVLEEWALQN